MFADVHRRVRPARALRALVFCLCLAAGGCGDAPSPGASAPPSSPDPDALPATPLFAGEAVQSLRDVRADFRTLLADTGFDRAREALLLELADGRPQVTSAELAADGTTIFLRMDDGALAALDTTDFSALWQGADTTTTERPRDAIRENAGSSRLALAGRSIQPALTAPWRPIPIAADIVTPTRRKALLLTAAGVTDPIAVDTVEGARGVLMGHGWKDDDIDLLARTEAGDEITPEDFFRLRGYGLIIWVGHGGWDYFDGVPLHYFQCCSNVDFSFAVGADRQAQYEAWKAEGKMILFTYADPLLGDAEDIYLRSDLLEEQVGPLPFSHVHMLSCYSIAASHAFMSNDAGDFWGWDHKGPALQGKLLIQKVLEEMLDDEPRTDTEAAAALDADRSYPTPSGYVSRLKLRYWTDLDFFLPSWTEVTVDAGNAPGGTRDIWIDLVYTDPGLAAAGVHELLDGSPHRFDQTLPAEARIVITAVDGSGATLASGQETALLHAGLNTLAVDFCTADALFTVADVPSAVATLASVEVEAVYDDPTVPPIDPFSLDATTSTAVMDLLVRELHVTSEAFDSGGALLGISEQTFGLDCDANALEICFGWVTIHSDELPLDTASVTVETAFSDPVLDAPASVTYGPAAAATIIGFRVGAEVTFTATARNAVGQELGAKTITHTVTCGENDVAIDFFDYDIILTASPTLLEANGFSASLVTATLKKLTDDDVLAPTGAPVAGKTVAFDASLGTFVTANPVVSDANGVATVELVSAVEGTAAVRAFVVEDGVESDTVEVEFGDGGGAAPADELAVEVAPARAVLCMNDALVVNATVSAPAGANLEYSWRANMNTRRGDQQFWPLQDAAGNSLERGYNGNLVQMIASVWHEYSGSVTLRVSQVNDDGGFFNEASDSCDVEVKVCGEEVPITIDVVTEEFNGFYRAYPRAVFQWTEDPTATGYLLALHPNKSAYPFGTSHYSNNGFVVTTHGNINDIPDGSAGYVLASRPPTDYSEDAPDLSQFDAVLEEYRAEYGSYTVVVQPLYE